MTSCRLGLIALALTAGLLPVCADEAMDHFRGFPPPPDEARVLALTGVREFCGRYEIAPASIRFLRPLPQPPGNHNYQADFTLVAELYAGKTCTGRYLLSTAVEAFTDLAKPRTGTLSVGWNEEQHELTSVLANDQFYSPWTAHVRLPSFHAVDAHYFENARPEKRTSKESGDYLLYPVLGICGERTFKIPGGYNDVNDAAAFLGLCQYARAKNALILYLYATSLGDSPPLRYDNLSASR